MTVDTRSLHSHPWIDLLETPLDRRADALSLQIHVHERFKQAILSGRLAPGSRMPASRTLADSLVISRNTVTAAYDLLAAEGYIEPNRQGTRVALLSSPKRLGGGHAAPRLPALPERVTRAKPAVPSLHSAAALRPGVPALSHFPFAAWGRALTGAMQRHGAALLGYGDPLGEPALREAIAQHLGMARGVICRPSQVVITEGAQEALLLCVRLLTNPGDNAWIEDPGYRGAKAAMRAGDLHLVPMPVDGEGVRIDDGAWQTHPPKLIYTTPSHQYPTGAVLSVARRLDLIDKAAHHGAWIIEDDYDSEFRHAGEPIGAMQGLLPQPNVLYVGTFSKTMFPSLRLGFVVFPEALMSAIGGPLEDTLRGGHRVEQLALAEFVGSGQFSRHLGRMRRLYRERQGALREALMRHMPAAFSIHGGMGGMHLLLRLPDDVADHTLAERAQAQGMGLSALSGWVMKPGAWRNGLVLGYGNTSAERFEPLIKKLL